MNKKLKTLEEHNNSRNDFRFKLNQNEPRPNGIACPECGNELYDSCPNFTLTGNPPQKHTMCKNCDYVGYRVN